jgi:dienelactone hydrolase
MHVHNRTRRDFLKTVALAVAAASKRTSARAADKKQTGTIDKGFFIRPEELTLKFRHGKGQRRLSFSKFDGPAAAWKNTCRQKLAELLGFSKPPPCQARLFRSMQYQNVTIEAWVMQISKSLSIPAYLLSPKSVSAQAKAVMAIHGHGEAESCVGLRNDYHHAFALTLAKAGHLVLCPALRGFGALADMASSDKARCLDYWKSVRGRQFTLVSDAFLYGQTLVGQTVEDLLRWETWLSRSQGITTIDVAGISYGGDLALTYPVFSNRVKKIYASGTLGSFSVIFSRCYNAPAHCIPGILHWMDRSDIAGLNAPRPIRLHYGEKDTPGPHNNSASYNETVEPSLAELRTIYKAFDAERQISLCVTPGRWHEMDNNDLLAFLRV